MLAQSVLAEWKNVKVAHFKVDEKIVLQRIVEVIQEELNREVQLEKDVKKMLDDLERQHGGSFERHKMYTLLKQKLAKERKLIL